MPTSACRTVQADRFDSVASMIGNTPIVRLRHFRPGVASLFVKLEQFNPGGSIKDRTALAMIRCAEEQGRFRPGMHVVESSSGNTAIGLAMLARQRNYRITAICDRHLPLAKRARLLALGANIVFLPETPRGMDTVEVRIAIANHLALSSKHRITLNQYSNPVNSAAHYETTGPEIWAAMEHRIDAVVMAVGTCGTISGVGRFLKERNPAIRIIGVEPEGSVIFGGEAGPYMIQGGGLSFIPDILDRSVIDEGKKVSDRDALQAAHELAIAEGLMIGGTGGLVAYVLARLALELGVGRNVVGVIPDGGDRYLDTLYNEPWLAQNDLSLPRDQRYSGGVSVAGDDDFPEAVTSIGCSLNTIPPEAGPALDYLVGRLGVRLPPAAT